MKQGLIIGESFNPIDYGDTNVWSNSFHGLKASGKTILNWFDLSYEETWKIFDSLNIKNRNNNTIPYNVLAQTISQYKITLIFGRIAEHYLFNMTENILPYTKEIDNNQVFVFPHPSGRNRKLNNKILLNDCKHLCRALVKYIE